MTTKNSLVTVASSVVVYAVCSSAMLYATKYIVHSLGFPFSGITMMVQVRWRCELLLVYLLLR